MANLKTTYMGISLQNPIIAGASELTSNMNSIRKIGESGAGAMIIKSLFEEQIQLECARFDEEQHMYEGFNAEMGNVFPEMEHSGPEEHLMWVRKAREAVSIPVIASLNAVNRKTWSEWAVKLAETGVDGLELNFFANPDFQGESSASIEKEQITAVKDVVSSLKIPVSIKMSLFYTTPLYAARKFAEAGAKGLVLFNRFFHPDIDPKEEKTILPLSLSDGSENRLPLRYCGMLYGNCSADLCASGGIMQGEDVAKMILAGASTVQVVSTLYRNKVSHLKKIISDIGEWMDKKEYKSLDSFRGKLSQKNSPDPWTYKRAQYAKLLMKPDPLGFVR